MHCALVLLILATAPDAGTKGKPRPPKAQSMKRSPTVIAASLKAAASDDPRARSEAFLALSRQGVEKKVPDPEPNDPTPRCIAHKSDGACKDKAVVCNRSVEVDAEETHYASLDRLIGFGTTEAAAGADVADHLLSKSLKSGADSTEMQCVVVYLDACAHRAGMVCTTAVETVGVPSDAPPKTEVFDLTFK
jgi:hypothetical protein